MQPLQVCIGPIIRIGRESWCLPYAGFFCSSLPQSSSRDIRGCVVCRRLPMQFILRPLIGLLSSLLNLLQLRQELDQFQVFSWHRLHFINLKGGS